MPENDSRDVASTFPGEPTYASAHKHECAPKQSVCKPIDGLPRWFFFTFTLQTISETFGTVIAKWLELHLMGSAASIGSFSEEGGFIPFPPDKGAYPPMGLLKSAPAILLVGTWGTQCWAMHPGTKVRMRWWNPPPVPPPGYSPSPAQFCSSCLVRQCTSQAVVFLTARRLHVVTSRCWGPLWASSKTLPLVVEVPDGAFGTPVPAHQCWRQ